MKPAHAFCGALYACRYAHKITHAPPLIDRVLADLVQHGAFRLDPYPDTPTGRITACVVAHAFHPKPKDIVYDLASSAVPLELLMGIYSVCQTMRHTTRPRFETLETALLTNLMGLDIYTPWLEAYALRTTRPQGDTLSLSLAAYTWGHTMRALQTFLHAPEISALEGGLKTMATPFQRDEPADVYPFAALMFATMAAQHCKLAPLQHKLDQTLSRSYTADLPEPFPSKHGLQKLFDSLQG